MWHHLIAGSCVVVAAQTRLFPTTWLGLSPVNPSPPLNRTPPLRLAMYEYGFTSHDFLLVLEHPHCVGHGRPQLRLVLHAPRCHLAHHLRLFPVLAHPGHRHYVAESALVEPLPHPLGYYSNHRLRFLTLSHALTRTRRPPKYLEHEHNKDVHVTLVRHRERQPQLQCCVP